MQSGVFLLERAELCGAPEEYLEFFQLDRLGEKVEGAAIDGFERVLTGVVAGDEDDLE